MLLDTHGNRVWPRRRYRERDPTKVMGYLACEPLRLPKQDSFMGIRHLASALTIYVLVGSVQARAQESLVTNKSLAPEIALDLARAALADCQKRGYQVAIAVVDRFGVVQVVLRDRYAGPHTPATASG